MDPEFCRTDLGFFSIDPGLSRMYPGIFRIDPEFSRIDPGISRIDPSDKIGNVSVQKLGWDLVVQSSR